MGDFDSSICAFRWLVGVLVRCQSQSVVSTGWISKQSPYWRQWGGWETCRSSWWGEAIKITQRWWTWCWPACWRPSSISPGWHWGRTGSETRSVMLEEIRRGRAMAGLPQQRETPVGSSFLNQIHKSFDSTFTFWGQEISTTFVCCLVLSVLSKPPREQDASRRNMLWGNKYKILL